jgi:hypothetical protein
VVNAIAKVTSHHIDIGQNTFEKYKFIKEFTLSLPVGSMTAHGKTTLSLFSTTPSSIKYRGRPSRTLSDSDDTTPLRKLHN